MRYIEDLRNKHKGSEIWILGTGPSLDDYPQDFFDEKVSIALKYSGLLFPNCTYLLTYCQEQILYFMKENPEFIKKWILCLLRKDKKEHKWLGEYVNDPIYLRAKRFGLWKGDQIEPQEQKEAKKKQFFECINCIKQNKPCYYFNTEGHLHWAIQAAAILGAKRIICVGCIERGRKFGFHAKKLEIYYHRGIVPGKFIDRQPIPPGGHTSEEIEKIWNSFHEPNLLATRWLAQALKNYGIEVALYHLKDSKQYKAGYLKLA